MTDRRTPHFSIGTAARASALALSTVVTLLLASGVDHLATTPPTAEAQARAGQPVQVVVTARRPAQS